jgi:serine/threonine protein kinase
VLEYESGGSLSSLFENYAPLEELHAQFYLAEILLAIESIHSLKCFYRKLEPESILIDSKVTDIYSLI